MTPKAIAAAANYSNSSYNESHDFAFDQVVGEMKTDKWRLWTTNDLLDAYKSFGGEGLTRLALLNRIRQHFSDDIAVLSSSGLCSLDVFRNSASKVPTLTADVDDVHQDVMIDSIAKTVCKEIKQMDHDTTRYDIRITKDDISANASLTLLDFLARIPDGFESTLPALLIGNIATSKDVATGVCVGGVTPPTAN